MEWNRRVFLAASGALTTGAIATGALTSTIRGFASEDYGPSNADLTLVVRDPLAAQLACACVEGYAQRKYDKLADYLSRGVKKSIRVKWTESLTKLVESESFVPSIVVGKDSVVRAEAKRLNRVMVPIATLTDQNGSATQTGFFVVRGKNPAVSLIDLEGYKILFGPESCDEKYLAAVAKLHEAEVNFQFGETCETCSVAAKMLLELTDSDKSAAVISSYAEPLLVGCGNIKKGDLRVVAQTDEVPFISVFVDSTVPKDLRMAIREAFLKSSSDPKVLEILQSQKGFLPYASA
jgi:ABC-type phosphate/phosphonate transport system substrate-binding protein